MTFHIQQAYLHIKNIGRDHDGCFDQRLNKECLCDYTITLYKQLGIEITNKYIYFQPIPVFSTIPFFPLLILFISYDSHIPYPYSCFPSPTDCPTPCNQHECLYSFLLITQTCIASLMFLWNKGILGFHFVASIYINCQLLLSICYIKYN